VSDARGTFQIGVPQDNQGGAHVRRGTGAACDPDGGRCPSDETTTTTILMDDLLEVVDFRRAVLKIDIEGDERHAFFHADRLFDRVHVGYIFMEWMKLRGSGVAAFALHPPARDAVFTCVSLSVNEITQKY